MKKGFTLVELLAVIIILAIVALIALPIIMDVVEDSRKSAAKSGAAMVLSSVKNYFAENYFNTEFNGYTCSINNRTGCTELSLEGDRPDSAAITLSKDGFVNGSVTIGKYTYYYCNNMLTDIDCANIKTAADITYSNPLSANNCTNVQCALDELLGGNN